MSSVRGPRTSHLVRLLHSRALGSIQVHSKSFMPLRHSSSHPKTPKRRNAFLLGHFLPDPEWRRLWWSVLMVLSQPSGVVFTSSQTSPSLLFNFDHPHSRVVHSHSSRFSRSCALIGWTLLCWRQGQAYTIRTHLKECKIPRILCL